MFSAIVKAIYNVDYRRNPDVKEKLLERMKEDGYFLIDACDFPLQKNEDKEAKIKSNLPDLLKRLKEFKEGGLKIILIKNSIFDLLYEPLRKEGFNVLNKGRVGFPRYYNDSQTVREIRRLIWDKIETKSCQNKLLPQIRVKKLLITLKKRYQMLTWKPTENDVSQRKLVPEEGVEPTSP